MLLLLFLISIYLLLLSIVVVVVVALIAFKSLLFSSSLELGFFFLYFFFAFCRFYFLIFTWIFWHVPRWTYSHNGSLEEQQQVPAGGRRRRGGNCTDGHISKQITFDGGTLYGDDDDDEKPRRDTIRQDAGRGGARWVRVVANKKRKSAKKTHTKRTWNAIRMPKMPQTQSEGQSGGRVQKWRRAGQRRCGNCARVSSSLFLKQRRRSKGAGRQRMWAGKERWQNTREICHAKRIRKA